MGEGLRVISAGGGTRTHDSRLKRSVLYRLSYTRETNDVAHHKSIALPLSYAVLR